jgi:glutamyl/glutaminyl-tRNA synthetase
MEKYGSSYKTYSHESKGVETFHDNIDPFFENKKIEAEYHKAQECFSDALEDTEESNFDKAKEIKENFKKYLEKESSANEEEIRDYVDRHFVIGDEDFEELE